MLADRLLTQGFSLGKATNDKLPALAKANTQAKAGHSLLIAPRLKLWVNSIIHLGTQPMSYCFQLYSFTVFTNALAWSTGTLGKIP